MYTHLTQYEIKPDKKQVLLDYFENKALPMLKKMPGFGDVVLMRFEDKPNTWLTVGFWSSKELCMRFVNQDMHHLLEPIREYLVREPEMHNLVVEHTTLQAISAQAA